MLKHAPNCFGTARYCEDLIGAQHGQVAANNTKTRSSLEGPNYEERQAWNNSLWRLKARYLTPEMVALVQATSIIWKKPKTGASSINSHPPPRSGCKRTRF
eukprot:3766073-Amphidinium_carterae.1